MQLGAARRVDLAGRVEAVGHDGCRHLALDDRHTEPREQRRVVLVVLRRPEQNGQVLRRLLPVRHREPRQLRVAAELVPRLVDCDLELPPRVGAPRACERGEFLLLRLRRRFGHQAPWRGAPRSAPRDEKVSAPPRRRPGSVGHGQRPGAAFHVEQPAPYGRTTTSALRARNVCAVTEQHTTHHSLSTGPRHPYPPRGAHGTGAPHHTRPPGPRAPHAALDAALSSPRVRGSRRRRRCGSAWRSSWGRRRLGRA